MRHAADLKGLFVQKPQFLSSIHTLEYDIQKKIKEDTRTWLLGSWNYKAMEVAN